MAIPELQDSSGRLTDCIYFGDRLSANVGSGYVPNARTISTTAPLTGGGDLSNNRTFAITEFAGSAPGSVPTSLGGVVNFLRADGSWATPPTFGAAAAGYAPASGGGSTNYLRADGTWAAPAGTGISGLTTNFFTAATSATAIGGPVAAGGNIELTTTGLKLYTDYTSGAYNAGLLTVGGLDSIAGTLYSTLQLSSFVNTTTTVSYLTLTTDAGSPNAIVQLRGEDVKITGNVLFPEIGGGAANGINVDIGFDAGQGTAFLSLTGPTAAFSIGSIEADSTLLPDGRFLILHNTTAQPMTIKNEYLGGWTHKRIYTQTGGDVVLPAGTSTATFIYSSYLSRWILIQTNPPAQYPRTLGYVPYQNSGGNLADSTLFHDSANNFYGFATATPKATVDVNGTLATRQYAQALSNGLNSNIPAPTTSYCRITGPTGAFSVGGVTIVSGENGKRLTLHNTTAQAMTIVNEDASSTAANRITTLVGADVVFPARQSLVHLIYNSTTARWILEEANPVTAGGATTQVQSNLSGSLYGDSGLTVAGTGATKTLTLGTDVVLARKTTRHLHMGAPAASTAAYTITGQSTRGGTDSNLPGGDLSIGGGAGTGNRGGGDTILVTGVPGSLGNTQNTLIPRMTYGGEPVTLTDSVTNLIATMTVPTETGCGGTVYYTVYATDGTDMQIRRGRVIWGAVNKASTITIVFGTPEEVDCTPVGTLTVTVTAADLGSDDMEFYITPVSSLTTTKYVAWIAMAFDGDNGIVL